MLAERFMVFVPRFFFFNFFIRCTPSDSIREITVSNPQPALASSSAVDIPSIYFSQQAFLYGPHLVPGVSILSRKSAASDHASPPSPSASPHPVKSVAGFADSTDNHLLLHPAPWPQLSLSGGNERRVPIILTLIQMNRALIQLVLSLDLGIQARGITSPR